MMALTLPAEICSYQDLKAVILEIRRLGIWQAHKEVKTRVLGSDANQPPAISATASILVKQWHSQGTVTKESVTELVSALENLAQSAPRISITLAVPAPSNLKKELVSWCREQISPNILVQFQFSSSILGGMKVRYGSHVHDWTFRRMILAKLENFPEVLRRG